MASTRPLTYSRSRGGNIAPGDISLIGASIRYCHIAAGVTPLEFEIDIPYGKPENDKHLLVVLDNEDLLWMLGRVLADE